MLIIGVCGASGSGKSTLARILNEQLGAQSSIITQDCYYLDRGHLPLEERARSNYDEPAAFDHDLLLRDIKALKSGVSITKKGYDYVNHRRADTDELLQPTEVVIFEGIHAFYDERLRNLMDLKIYIHVDPDICLLRRVRRDINKRGRQIDGIVEQYLTTVKPMFEQHIRGYEQFADVIARGGKNQRITDILVFYIQNGMGS